MYGVHSTHATSVSVILEALSLCSHEEHSNRSILPCDRPSWNRLDKLLSQSTAVWAVATNSSYRYISWVPVANRNENCVFFLSSLSAISVIIPSRWICAVPVLLFRFYLYSSYYIRFHKSIWFVNIFKTLIRERAWGGGSGLGRV